MGTTSDDVVKQKLLYALSKESPMVISTAYAYAKNYVKYGEDITKAWTTAVQQASILERIKIEVRAEAYNSFKKEYENRLKADMVDMLEELKKEIIELPFPQREPEYMQGYSYCQMNILDYVIQEKINQIRGDKDETISL
jgi:hypothetical protein